MSLITTIEKFNKIAANLNITSKLTLVDIKYRIILCELKNSPEKFFHVCNPVILARRLNHEFPTDHDFKDAVRYLFRDTVDGGCNRCKKKSHPMLISKLAIISHRKKLSLGG